MVVWWWAVRCPMGRKRLQFSEEFVRKPRVEACFFFQSGCQVACGLCLGGLWTALGWCVGCAWWLVGCSWWVGWIVLDGCLGYAQWLFGLCLAVVRTASEGHSYCILWLPGLYHSSRGRVFLEYAREPLPHCLLRQGLSLVVLPASTAALLPSVKCRGRVLPVYQMSSGSIGLS